MTDMLSIKAAKVVIQANLHHSLFLKKLILVVHFLFLFFFCHGGGVVWFWFHPSGTKEGSWYHYIFVSSAPKTVLGI